MPKDIKQTIINHYSYPSKWEIRKNILDYLVPKTDFNKELFLRLDMKDTSFIDIGCGSGELLFYIKNNLDRKGKFVGVDISQNMLKKGLSTIRDFDIDFILADMTDVPIKDSSFNNVICNHSLYHSLNIRKTLSEFKRILKSDGKIIITTGSKFNRPLYRSIKRDVFKQFGINEVNFVNQAFNLENSKEFLKGFSEVKINVLKHKLKINDPKILASFFASTLDWNRSLKEGNKAVKVFYDAVNSIINSKGVFEDENIYTLIEIRP